MGKEKEVVEFNAERMWQIERVCEMYIARRNSAKWTYPPPSHTEFIQMCNINGRMLEQIIGQTSEENALMLYRTAIEGSMPLSTNELTIAFRELLGVIVGLHQIRRNAITANN